MKVLVTGADGFIGRNLCVALREREGFDVLPITRASSEADLAAAVAGADAVIHLAGVNRPTDPVEFATGNADFPFDIFGVAEFGRRGGASDSGQRRASPVWPVSLIGG